MSFTYSELAHALAQTQQQGHAELSDAELEAVAGGTEGLQSMESLRLQMSMDRLSKMNSTLSNLMKKMSDTSSGIYPEHQVRSGIPIAGLAHGGSSGQADPDWRFLFNS